MLKIKISRMQNSDLVNVGETHYSIEPEGSIWLFKKADSNIIIRKNSNKEKLNEFAKSYCSTHNAQLSIMNISGKTEEIIEFKPAIEK